MENNVVSLAMAKKLKAAGFPQDKATVGYSNMMRLTEHEMGLDIYRDYWEAAAPTAQEIADQLSDQAGSYLVIDCPQSGYRPTWYKAKWSAYYTTNSGRMGLLGAYGDTMAEALAALWIKLQEGEKHSPLVSPDEFHSFKNTSEDYDHGDH